MPRSAVPLVGRDEELVGLVSAVSGAIEGQASALVVGGDAGVGKTRLLAELMAVAASDGVLCLAGHCIDLGDTPPPYLPFTEAFSRLAADRHEVVDGLIDQFPALVRLFPNRPASIAQADDRVDRGDLFDSVHGALAVLSAAQPVALLIEDVHWADQATRDLLGFLFTRLGNEHLVIVSSYRSDDLHRRHPLRRSLAEWSRLPAVTRTDLEPLGIDDIRSLIRAMTAEISDSDIENIVRRADGNAFFAEELLAAAVQCAGTVQLPWQLADLLLVRLDRLSDGARQVVRVAAVAGRRVSHPMLDAVAHLPSAKLDAALREAVDSHVLELTSSGRGYTFRHALLAEAVYDDLLPGERVRLHSAYATVIGADPQHRPAELARHAIASHDIGTAFGASIAAGDEAMGVAAPREALQHYEVALELAPQSVDLEYDRPMLILAAVEAADACGLTQRGARLAERALADLPEDAPAADRATVLYASALASLAHEIGDDALARTAEALRLVPVTPPSAFRARLLALHARVAYVTGHDVDAERTSHEAVEIGVAVGSNRALTDARTTLAMLERRRGDPDEAVRQLRVVVEQARSSGDFAAELRSRFSLASLWHELCDLGRAQEAFEQTYQRAIETGRSWDMFGVHSRAMLATMQYLRGDWDAAERTVDISTEQPTLVGGALLRSMAMPVRAGRGDVSVLDQFAELRPLWAKEARIGLYAGVAVLEIHEQNADVDASLALIDELVEVLGSLWLDPWFLARIELNSLGLATLAAAAAVAPESRHAELAAHGVRLLIDGRRSADKGLPDTRAMGREGRAWLARLEAEAARLRWLTGQDPPGPSELVMAWKSAVEEFDYGNEVQLCRCRVRLAEALRATGRAAEALEVADLARTAADGMNATALSTQIRAVGAGRGAVGTKAQGLPGLTERERGVLSELVDGRTNRQIAAKLFISEKTVSVHVSNILAKLGVRSRAEAAAVSRRGAATS